MNEIVCVYIWTYNMIDTQETDTNMNRKVASLVERSQGHAEMNTTHRVNTSSLRQLEV